MGRPFPKGVSGNPSGRPKGVAELLARFRANATPEDMDALYRGLMDIAANTEEDPKARVVATRELLDRLVGKPVQSLEVTDLTPPGAAMDLSRLTSDELRTLRALTEKARKEGGGDAA